MDFNFDKIFKIMILAMRINRSHPDIPRDKKWVIQFLVMHGAFSLVFFLLIYSIVYHDLKNNDFAQACSNGIVCVIYSVVTFKYCIMLSFQSLLRDMFEKMKNDFRSATELPAHEQNILQQYVQKGKLVTKLWFWITFGTCALFPIKSIVGMSYYAIIGEFKYIHIYDLTYPSQIEEVKNDLGPYIVINIFLLFYDAYAMFMYLGFAPMGPIFMLHVCGQLEIVKKRVLEVFSGQKFDSEKSRNKLKDVVIRLQKIYSFVDDIKRGFKVVYEITLKTSAIAIPITLHQVIQSYHNGQISIEFITVIFAAIALCSIPCYYSDLLMETGENVRLAIYSCGWEMSWDRGTRSVLMLLLVRAARPVAIRTMFRTVCLDAMTDLFHQSYAIFNFLNVAQN